jgi:hypothetical protein
MEILDLKLAGITLWTWCAIIGLAWFLYRMYLIWHEAKARRELIKTYLAAQEHEDEISNQISRNVLAAVKSEMQKQEQQLG